MIPGAATGCVVPATLNPEGNCVAPAAGVAPKPANVCPGAVEEGSPPNGAEDAGVVPKPPPNVSGLVAATGALRLKGGAAAVLAVLAPKPPKLKAGAVLVVEVVPNPPNAGAVEDVAVEANPPNAGA